MTIIPRANVAYPEISRTQATIFTAQDALLHDPRWAKFSFVFYTESDQVFHARSVDRLLKIAGNADARTRVRKTGRLDAAAT